MPEGVGIEDKQYVKEFADWEDVKEMIEFIIVDDLHCYHDRRFVAQIIFIFLLVADNGERIGAFTRSEAHRGTNVALCYKVSCFR
jgi:hypothetical protein